MVENAKKLLISFRKQVLIHYYCPDNKLCVKQLMRIEYTSFLEVMFYSIYRICINLSPRY